MLSLLGLVTIFIATFYAYKTAKDYERNAVMWAFIVFGVGFGIQFVVPFFVGIIIGVVMTIGGSSPLEIQESIYSYALILNILFIILSVVVMILILKYLGTVPDDVPPPKPPPPPPEFDKN